MIQLTPGLSIVEVEDGKVVLDTRRGVYWHLNQTAIQLVEELTRGRAFDDVVAEIARATGADADRVRSDHEALIHELRRAKLVKGRLR